MNVVGKALDFPLIDDRYHQVTDLPALNSDNDSEFEEDEVSYLILDVGKSLHISELDKVHSIQIMNLEGDSPLVKIGRHVFQGTHEDLIGSEILLEEHHSGDAPPSHSVVGLASSHLRLDPVSLAPKSEAEALALARSAEAPTKRGTGKPRGRPRTRKEAPSRADEESEEAEGAKPAKTRRKAKKAAALEARPIAAQAATQEDEDEDLEYMNPESPLQATLHVLPPTPAQIARSNPQYNDEDEDFGDFDMDES